MHPSRSMTRQSDGRDNASGTRLGYPVTWWEARYEDTAVPDTCDLQARVQVRAEYQGNATLVIEVYSGDALQTSDTVPVLSLADSNDFMVPPSVLFVPAPSIACGIRRTSL